MEPQLFAYFRDICHGLTYYLVSSDTYAYTSDDEIYNYPAGINKQIPLERSTRDFLFPSKAKIFVVITLKD